MDITEERWKKAQGGLIFLFVPKPLPILRVQSLKQ